MLIMDKGIEITCFLLKKIHRNIQNEHKYFQDKELILASKKGPPVDGSSGIP